MLNRPDRKLFTVEDPIEYQLERINQVQVHAGIGFDFPHALRSILRQDPDIIMIGEIRDLETARIAVQASLTGHLVFSTLHTNSAAASITRLVDMGIENYLLASTLRGVLAQRLVRRLCRQCGARLDNSGHWAQEIASRVTGIEAQGPADLRKPVGCNACGDTGYSGRTTIAELMVVDGEIERLILAAASDADLEQAARSQGMLTMYEAGMAKVWAGVTTIDEVLSVTRVG
jgi:general secretion pathway protein E